MRIMINLTIRTLLCSGSGIAVFFFVMLYQCAPISNAMVLLLGAQIIGFIIIYLTKSDVAVSGEDEEKYFEKNASVIINDFYQLFLLYNCVMSVFTTYKLICMDFNGKFDDMCIATIVMGTVFSIILFFTVAYDKKLEYDEKYALRIHFHYNDKDKAYEKMLINNIASMTLACLGVAATIIVCRLNEFAYYKEALNSSIILIIVAMVYSIYKFFIIKSMKHRYGIRNSRKS